jgi:ATP-dependent helicase/nuclease subunit B
LIRLNTDIYRALRQGAAAIVPSRQRSHALRLAFAAAELKAGRRVWSTPDVLTFEAWLAREVEEHAAGGAAVPRTLSNAEDWLMWRQCAAEATRDWDLVNRGALAEALRKANSLAADFRIDLQDLPIPPGTEPALLYQVQRAVRERCRALGAVSLAGAADALPTTGVHGDRLRVEGFLKVPPRLAAIAGLTATATASDDKLKRPKGVIAADDLTELELIAQWCRKQIERSSEARLLVVLPGSPGARERLATLIQQAADPGGWLDRHAANALVTIEGGSPLARNSAISHALSTLKWLGGEAGDFEAVSEWLRSAYWQVPDAGARARLDLWLRERPRMQFDLPGLAAELRAGATGISTTLSAASLQIATHVSEALAILGKGAASPREWSQRFRSVLGVFGWPGERVRSSDAQQTLMRFHELLDEFGQLAASVGSMSREAAIQWFVELAARTPFRAADEDPIVTVTPMFADPIVKYDAIWVAGLHSEGLPEPVQPDPFLPLAAQLAAGIPAASAAGRLQEARSLIRAWRAATDELVLSAPARSEDLELLPSPLLAPWLPRARSKSPAPADDALWTVIRRRSGLLEAVDDRVGVEWDSQRALPGGTRSLDLQNACPFRAYAELRLGSEKLDAPEPGVAATLRGELLHGALQRFWTQVCDSRALQALDDPSELIERCVREAARDVWGSAQDSRAIVRERRRVARLICSLCELERQRAPFTVTATERRATLPLAGTKIDLRIDRVDQLGAGGLAVLDYKSGQRPTADWYGERPSHPQLLAYMAAVGEDVVAMATVNVTAKEVRFDGIASSAQLLPKVKGVVAPEDGEGDAWASRRREWLERIERLAAGFVAGHAAVDPKQGACDYCHVRTVCRIGERADTEAELIEEALDD